LFTDARADSPNDQIVVGAAKQGGPVVFGHQPLVFASTYQMLIS